MPVNPYISYVGPRLNIERERESLYVHFLSFSRNWVGRCHYNTTVNEHPFLSQEVQYIVICIFIKSYLFT